MIVMKQNEPERYVHLGKKSSDPFLFVLIYVQQVCQLGYNDYDENAMLAFQETSTKRETASIAHVEEVYSAKVEAQNLSRLKCVKF